MSKVYKFSKNSQLWQTSLERGEIISFTLPAGNFSSEYVIEKTFTNEKKGILVPNMSINGSWMFGGFFYIENTSTSKKYIELEIFHKQGGVAVETTYKAEVFKYNSDWWPADSPQYFPEVNVQIRLDFIRYDWS